MALAAGAYAALVLVPADLFQGDVQRIFYFHISVAWVAYLAFFVIFVSSAMYLWRRTDRWDTVAWSSAELGLISTTLVLITGSFWAKSAWGTWWTWDPRLTTTLILWFIYVAYLMLRAYSTERGRAARQAAVLGIVGFLDVPVIHWSVILWRNLHPEPVVLRSGGPAMPAPMIWTMVLCVVAFGLLYAYLLIQNVRRHDARDAMLRLRAAETDEADDVISA